MTDEPTITVELSMHEARALAAAAAFTGTVMSPYRDDVLPGAAVLPLESAAMRLETALMLAEVSA